MLPFLIWQYEPLNLRRLRPAPGIQFIHGGKLLDNDRTRVLMRSPMQYKQDLGRPIVAGTAHRHYLNG